MSKIAGWVANSVDPDAAFCVVWSDSTLFTKICVSKHLGQER